MVDDRPYTPEELAASGDTWPTRGPFCPKCGNHIPQFALLQKDSDRLRYLLQQGRTIMAIQELRAATGRPLSWAKSFGLFTRDNLMHRAQLRLAPIVESLYSLHSRNSVSTALWIGTIPIDPGT